MATISGTCSLNPTRYTYYATWSESNVNATNNTSVVTATLYIAKVSTYRAEGSNNPNTMYIDGTAVSSNIYIDLNPASSSTMVTVTILSGSKTITHDANGAKSITISASGTLPYGNGYGPQSGSLSGTAVLTTITRATTASTQAASSVTSDSATANGTVTDTGIPANTDKGIYWGTSSGNLPNKLAVGSGGAGAFTRSMTSLSPGTTYYYKAYSQNSGGYAYGAEVNFTTAAVAPTVTTQSASSVTHNSATGNGNITATGGAAVSRRGFCYKAGTSGDPTVSDSTVYDDGSFGTGAYTKSITGLSANTAYRVRAYATNSAGTGYGTTVSVTTYTEPTVTTQNCSNVTFNAATGNGNITSIGGTAVTRRGFCYIQAASGDPTVSDSVVYDDGSFSTGAYTKGITSLATSTAYRVRAYAINAIGTSYGTTVDLVTEGADVPVLTSDGVKYPSKMSVLLQATATNMGDYAITEKGFYWGLTPATMSNKIVVALGGGLGSFVARVSGLQAGTTYHYKAYATNVAGDGHGDTIEFVTAGNKPVIGGKYPLPPNDVEGI